MVVSFDFKPGSIYHIQCSTSRFIATHLIYWIHSKQVISVWSADVDNVAWNVLELTKSLVEPGVLFAGSGITIISEKGLEKDLAKCEEISIISGIHVGRAYDPHNINVEYENLADRMDEVVAAATLEGSRWKIPIEVFNRIRDSRYN